MSNERLGRRTIGLVAAGSVMGFVAAGGVMLASTAQSKDTLEARLQAVEDRAAIEQLMMGDYSRALDGRDWKAYAATFTEDGVLVGTPNVVGRKAIEENFANPRPPRCPRPAAATPPAASATPAAPPISKHIITNLTLQLHGDTATSQAYWQTVSMRDGKTTIAGAGHYVDELRRVNGKWLFSKREIVNPGRPPANSNAPCPGAAPAAAPAR